MEFWLQRVERNGTRAALGDEHGGWFPIKESRHEVGFTLQGRRLEAFTKCANCTCCKSGNENCQQMSCCSVIDCNNPNKPYGTCTFTPKSCGCTGC